MQTDWPLSHILFDFVECRSAFPANSCDGSKSISGASDSITVSTGCSPVVKDMRLRQQSTAVEFLQSPVPFMSASSCVPNIFPVPVLRDNPLRLT